MQNINDGKIVVTSWYRLIIFKIVDISSHQINMCILIFFKLKSLQQHCTIFFEKKDIKQKYFIKN